MKTSFQHPFLLNALVTALVLILSGRLTAQTFTVLHGFTNSPDGANPAAGLVLSGNTLYGTASVGGRSGQGTVFKVNADGTGFTNFYSFTALNNSTNSDGANPQAGLILSGNTLYGTAEHGGTNGNGTVFAISTNGTVFKTLHTFTVLSVSFPNTNSDGAKPVAGLILSGNTLYGTAPYGGTNGQGTVFAVNTDGTGFTNLHNFIGLTNDGSNPQAGLILSGNTLYGTAEYSLPSPYGTVFKVNTDGSSFTTLDNFAYSHHGATPIGGLILSGNTLYGTTANGTNGNGAVFAVSTNGTGFTNLYNFTGGNDGASPEAGLILSDNTLYGTAYFGGDFGNGTVFAVSTNGNTFTALHTFTALDAATGTTNSDGADPQAGLISSGNTLYGTAYFGGSAGWGTVFSLALPVPPQLTIIRSGTNVIVSWQTNFAAFTLESTTNLVPPMVWTTNSPVPVVVNGLNTVTNPTSGLRKFYRLIQ